MKNADKKPYRVLVMGSRDLLDRKPVNTSLNAIWITLSGRRMTVVEGYCPTGPDAFTRAWAVRHRRFRVESESHRADWHRFGLKAGPERNKHMVGLGADEALAFIGPCTRLKCRRPEPHGSHGVTGCADLAEAAGIPTTRHEYWKTTEKGTVA